MRFRGLASLVLAAVLCPGAARAYSVQTHEQLVDLAWRPSIEPLLLARYPGLTQAQLIEAHAYAYGGCAIQDLGYYPFGNEFFSDLTHYVRSGDFIQALLRDAHNANELAFAIGALTHYLGDTYGHGIATNPAVAQEFPKLRRQFGPVVTYDENPHKHVQVEFAFDINEIAHHRFAPSRYLEHVGLHVARPLLAQAFLETYGLPITEVLGGNKRPTLTGYNFAVRHFLPRIAYALNLLHRHRMPDDTPGPDFDQFRAALAQSDFENGWAPYRRKPGIGTYSLAGFIFILPKFGPLALLAIKGPNADTEDTYIRSVNRTNAAIHDVLEDGYRAFVSGGKPALAIALAKALPNRDLDTGDLVRPGTYRLTDLTYAKLLQRLSSPRIHILPAGLNDNIASFYGDPDGPNFVRENAPAWTGVQLNLQHLKTLPTTPDVPSRDPDPSPV